MLGSRRLPCSHFFYFSCPFFYRSLSLSISWRSNLAINPSTSTLRKWQTFLPCLKDVLNWMHGSDFWLTDRQTDRDMSTWSSAERVKMWWLDVRVLYYSYVSCRQNRYFINCSTWGRSGLSTWKYQFSYNHWSQATLSSVSTWMGNCSSVAWALLLTLKSARFD